jgi:hypothetical protein
MMLRVIPVLLAAAGLAAGCGGSTKSKANNLVDDLVACQGIRWPVKTGTDEDAGKVSSSPVPTTIAQLAALTEPITLLESSRNAPTELTTFRLTNVTVFKQSVAGDLDANLLITDGSTTMIAEIPSPQCVGSTSPFSAGISSARAVFDAEFPSGSAEDVSLTATIIGVGFFDVPHGQEHARPTASSYIPSWACALAPTARRARAFGLQLGRSC